MKGKLILLALIVLCTINSTNASSNQNFENLENLLMDCSGNFDIDGKSYTITLHDVSLWTCTKFKVASWFN
jgi:hypothetical protein